MHTDADKLDPDVLAAMSYETRDINIKAILMASVGFLVFTLGGIAAVSVLFMIPGFKAASAPAARPLQNVTAPAGTPILHNNMNNTEDITELRKKEKQVMESTAQLPDGYYRIPVEQAMNIVAQRGIDHSPPVPPKANADAAAGHVAPGSMPQGMMSGPDGAGTPPSAVRNGFSSGNRASMSGGASAGKVPMSQEQAKRTLDLMIKAAHAKKAAAQAAGKGAPASANPAGAAPAKGGSSN